MHGLPKGFDPTRFVGLEVELVSFAAYSFYLNFDRAAILTVHSSFVHQMPGDAEPEEASGHPVIESKLMQLSGKTIVSAETDDESTLILTFSNAHRLYVFDDQPMYECYTMKFGDEEIFV